MTRPSIIEKNRASSAAAAGPRPRNLMTDLEVANRRFENAMYGMGETGRQIYDAYGRTYRRNEAHRMEMEFNKKKRDWQANDMPKISPEKWGSEWNEVARKFRDEISKTTDQQGAMNDFDDFVKAETTRFGTKLDFDGRNAYIRQIHSSFPVMVDDWSTSLHEVGATSLSIKEDDDDAQAQKKREILKIIGGHVNDGVLSPEGSVALRTEVENMLTEKMKAQVQNNILTDTNPETEPDMERAIESIRERGSKVGMTSAEISYLEKIVSARYEADEAEKEKTINDQKALVRSRAYKMSGEGNHEEALMEIFNSPVFPEEEKTAEMSKLDSAYKLINSKGIDPFETTMNPSAEMQMDTMIRNDPQSVTHGHIDMMTGKTDGFNRTAGTRLKNLLDERRTRGVQSWEKSIEDAVTHSLKVDKSEMVNKKEGLVEYTEHQQRIWQKARDAIAALKVKYPDGDVPIEESSKVVVDIYGEQINKSWGDWIKDLFVYAAPFPMIQFNKRKGSNTPVTKDTPAEEMSDEELIEFLRK